MGLVQVENGPNVLHILKNLRRDALVFLVLFHLNGKAIIAQDHSASWRCVRISTHEGWVYLFCNCSVHSNLDFLKTNLSSYDKTPIGNIVSYITN